MCPTSLVRSLLVVLALTAGADAAKKKRRPPTDLVSQRPPLEERCFTSESVEATIRDVKPRIADAELAWMFENCYPNTLDTTVDYEVLDGKPDTFVITGDTDAMWLRDSTAQVWPYLPYVDRDEPLRKLVEGLVRRQTKCVLLDPYANAFYKDFTRKSEWDDDRPKLKPGVHERKWEIDSLCYAVRLANEYHRLTGDASVFDEDWRAAMRLVVDTFKTEQRKNGTPYRFWRKTTAMIDAPPFDGTGRPVKPVGLIASAFRPSDDSTLFPFLVSSNLFAVQSLRQLETIFGNAPGRVTVLDEKTVYWRPPAKYLEEPDTMLAVLRKLLVRPVREQAVAVAQ